MKRNRTDTRRGAALGTVLIFMLVIAVLCTALMVLLRGQMNATAAFEKNEQAYYNAESAAQLVGYGILGMMKPERGGEKYDPLFSDTGVPGAGNALLTDFLNKIKSDVINEYSGNYNEDELSWENMSVNIELSINAKDGEYLWDGTDCKKINADGTLGAPAPLNTVEPLVSGKYEWYTFGGLKVETENGGRKVETKFTAMKADKTPDPDKPLGWDYKTGDITDGYMYYINCGAGETATAHEFDLDAPMEQNADGTLPLTLGFAQLRKFTERTYSHWDSVNNENVWITTEYDVCGHDEQKLQAAPHTNQGDQWGYRDVNLFRDADEDSWKSTYVKMNQDATDDRLVYQVVLDKRVWSAKELVKIQGQYDIVFCFRNMLPTTTQLQVKLGNGGAGKEQILNIASNPTGYTEYKWENAEFTWTAPPGWTWSRLESKLDDPTFNWDSLNIDGASFDIHFNTYSVNTDLRLHYILIYNERLNPGGSTGSEPTPIEPPSDISSNLQGR